MCNTLFGKYLATGVRPLVCVMYTGTPTQALESEASRIYGASLGDATHLLQRALQGEQQVRKCRRLMLSEPHNTHGQGDHNMCIIIDSKRRPNSVQARAIEQRVYVQGRAGRGGKQWTRGGTGPRSNTWRRQASDGDADRRARQQA